MAGSAAATASVLVGTGFQPARSFDSGSSDEDGEAYGPYLKLSGVVRRNGDYVCAAVVDGRFGLYQLEVDASGVPGARRVRLGGELGASVPPSLIWGELSTAADKLLLVGGAPFVWKSEELDFEFPDELRGKMQTYPTYLPSEGSHTVDTWGVEPAAYLIDPPEVVPLDLPMRPRRLIGFAAAAVEVGDGELTILVSHSEDREEGMYASGVEIIEGSGGAWRVSDVAADLGESGPYALALQAGEPVATVTSGRSSTEVYSRASQWRGSAEIPFVDEEVKGATTSRGGRLSVFSASLGAPLRRWSQVGPGDPWRDDGLVSMEGELVVDVAPVRGSDGEALLVGPTSAWLITVA